MAENIRLENGRSVMIRGFKSYTCPWFDDEFTASETRAARGEDGKTYQVPANMKYQDWRDYFVDHTKDPAKLLKPAKVERTQVADKVVISSNSGEYQLRKPVLLEGKTVETKIGTVNLRRVRGYDSKVFVSEKVKLESEEIRAFVKRTHDAMDEWGIPKKYRPQIQIMDYTELGAYGSYDPSTGIVRYSSVIKSQADLDMIAIKYTDIPKKTIPGFGYTERHEIWHMAQAYAFRKQGWNITQKNKQKYLEVLREKCKSNLDRLGVTKDNVSSISPYAKSMYTDGYYDEVEAEYMVYLGRKE